MEWWSDGVMEKKKTSRNSVLFNTPLLHYSMKSGLLVQATVTERLPASGDAVLEVKGVLNFAKA